MENKFYAATDVGGTKIYTVLADADGNIMEHIRLDTRATEGPDVIIGQIAESVREVLSRAGKETGTLTAAGVCAAGFFDWKKRVLVHSPNMPGWNNVPLEDKLSAQLGIPVLAENDANAAALGEACRGAGHGSRDVVFITVSTGIGAGLVLDGRIYRGTSGFAGEAGHMVVKPDGPLCGCGRYGCLETVASGTAIAKAATRIIKSGRRTQMAEMANGEEIKAPQVFAAARSGDKAAQDVLAEAIYYLGIGLVNLINLFNPEVLVIGGGVSQAGDDLFIPLRKIIQENAVPPAAASVTLRPAKLGVEAGVAGMLALLQQEKYRKEG
ncbi:MAG: ROK family protein [Bacillota bacterium]|nr:ROK family protein [Bacillota bacterium]MDW7683602.1 ROK family protein [Bacillota bacterium]